MQAIIANDSNAMTINFFARIVMWRVRRKLHHTQTNVMIEAHALTTKGMPHKTALPAQVYVHYIGIYSVITVYGRGALATAITKALREDGAVPVYHFLTKEDDFYKTYKEPVTKFAGNDHQKYAR